MEICVILNGSHYTFEVSVIPRIREHVRVLNSMAPAVVHDVVHNLQNGSIFVMLQDRTPFPNM